MAPQPAAPRAPLASIGVEEDVPAPPKLMVPANAVAVGALEVTAPEPLALPLTGWLLKKRAIRSPATLANFVAGTFMEGLFWRRRYFELNAAQVLYWAPGDEAGPPRGSFPLADVDAVEVIGCEVLLNFAVRKPSGEQRCRRTTLQLMLPSNGEAERWAVAVRDATAAQLRTVLPPGWNVGAMLDTVGARRVAKVPLSPAVVSGVQDMLDLSFFCKRTKDRRGEDMPLRLQVKEVISVQNVAAWMAYAGSRELVQQRTDQGVLTVLVPEILSDTLDASEVLGELGKGANEHWLLHGTTEAAVQGITDTEFRVDLAGTHRGSMYGKAVYLAECSSKADEYAEEGSDGLCRMLVCRAALGRVLVEDARNPSGEDLANRCQGREYDSVCGDRWTAVGTFREFVLYDSSQVYPSYIVLYRRIPQAELLKSIWGITMQSNASTTRELVTHAARLAESHPDPQVRYQISLFLGAEAALVTPALTERLRDERAPLRRTAATTLGNLAAYATLGRSLGLNQEGGDRHDHPVAHAVPALTVCLRDPNDGVRKAAATALKYFRSHAAPAVPALTGLLCDASEDVRTAAASTLEKLGPLAAPAVPALVECLKDPVVGVRRVAAAALGQLGHHALPAVPVLIESLGNIHETVRKAAAGALMNLGEYAAAAVPALVLCLQDDSAAVRQAAALALGHIGLHERHRQPRKFREDPPTDTQAAETIRLLTEALRDANEDVRVAAATSLGRLHKHATSALPLLTKCLRDSNDEVRKAAATSMVQFGKDAAMAVPQLIQCLSDTSAQVRKMAAVALGQISVPSAPVLAALRARLKDPSENVRKASAVSLDRLRRFSKAPSGEDASRKAMLAMVKALGEMLLDSENSDDDGTDGHWLLAPGAMAFVHTAGPSHT